VTLPTITSSKYQRDAEF